MDAETTGFEIDGKTYPVPTIDTFTLDEAQILYDYAGLTIEDFLEDEDGDDKDTEQRIRNPGFVRALLHVAYQRGNPSVRPARVKQLAGSINVMQALQELLADTLVALREAEGDAGPPESTSEQLEPSQTSSLENSSSSSPSTETPGSDSTTGSDAPATPQPATGVLRSVTPPISGQEISAA